MKVSGEGNRIELNVGVVSHRRSNGGEHVGVLKKKKKRQRRRSDLIKYLICFGFCIQFCSCVFLGLGSGEWDGKNSDLEKGRTRKHSLQSILKAKLNRVRLYDRTRVYLTQVLCLRYMEIFPRQLQHDVEIEFTVLDLAF